MQTKDFDECNFPNPAVRTLCNEFAKLQEQEKNKPLEEVKAPLLFFLNYLQAEHRCEFGRKLADMHQDFNYN